MKRFTGGVGSSCVLPAGVGEASRNNGAGILTIAMYRDALRRCRRAVTAPRGSQKPVKRRKKCNVRGARFFSAFLFPALAAEFAPNLPASMEMPRASLINRSSSSDSTCLRAARRGRQSAAPHNCYIYGRFLFELKC